MLIPSSRNYNYYRRYIGDPLETDMSDRRPIEDHYTWSETDMSHRRLIGLAWSIISVSDQVSQSPIEQVRLRWVSDQKYRSLMRLQWVSDRFPIIMIFWWTRWIPDPPTSPPVIKIQWVRIHYKLEIYKTFCKLWFNLFYIFIQCVPI